MTSRDSTAADNVTPLPAATSGPVRLIDCDTHPALQSMDELREYLPEPWRSRPIEMGGGLYVSPSGGRLDAYPADGGGPGSDPNLFYHQLLEEAGVDFAILGPMAAGYYPNPEMQTVLKSAVNSWEADTWLGKYNSHGRYKGSICVAVDDPKGAVAEIERWAGHPHFVQVAIGTWGRCLYGQELYHPIWEAASRHRLPVAAHFENGLPPQPSPAGYLANYLQMHSVANPMMYASQVVSLVCEGVFEKYPDYRFVCIEGGWSWIGPLMWRLDRSWSSLRAELPKVRRRPSEYIYENVRLTTQPIEEPDAKDLLQMLELIEAERLLLFSSDYPHWDFDNPKRALPKLPAEAHERIYHGNARELYRLPATVAVAPYEEVHRHAREAVPSPVSD